MFPPRCRAGAQSREVEPRRRRQRPMPSRVHRGRWLASLRLGRQRSESRPGVTVTRMRRGGGHAPGTHRVQNRCRPARVDILGPPTYRSSGLRERGTAPHGPTLIPRKHIVHMLTRLPRNGSRIAVRSLPTVHRLFSSARTPINVSGFVGKNFTLYNGDSSFLRGPTERRSKERGQKEGANNPAQATQDFSTRHLQTHLDSSENHWTPLDTNLHEQLI